MTEFKAGDRVRHKTVNDTGTVAGPAAPLGGLASVAVDWDEDGGRLSAYAHNLELIEPSEDDWKQSAEDLKESLSGHDALVKGMENLLQSWLETFDKKQRAYGPDAIANAPLGALQGLLNRVHDKYSRWVQLTNNPDVDDLGEAVKDTIQDLGIYCAMAVLVSEGKWPGV